MEAARPRSFESMAMFRATTMNLTGAGEPMMLKGARISANTPDVLGVRPLLGRSFTEAEEKTGQDHVVILSHELWTERFQSDPAVIGRKILLDGSPFLVVGVMPREFRLPLSVGPIALALDSENRFYKPLGYSNDDLKDRVGGVQLVRGWPASSGRRGSARSSELNVHPGRDLRDARGKTGTPRGGDSAAGDAGG